MQATTRTSGARCAKLELVLQINMMFCRKVFAHDVLSRFSLDSLAPSANPLQISAATCEANIPEAKRRFGDNLVDDMRAVGLEYRQCILEPGASMPGEAMLTAFLGRAPNHEAFVRNVLSEAQ
jgi:hypothetical protein